MYFSTDFDQTHKPIVFLDTDFKFTLLFYRGSHFFAKFQNGAAHFQDVVSEFVNKFYVLIKFFGNGVVYIYIINT